MKLLSTANAITVYKAMSPRQLAALIRADWRCIEPGQGGERFCYLKLNCSYAQMIARRREAAMHGLGHVVKLILPEQILNRYDLETVAYEEHLEYRVPVSDLKIINQCMVGRASLVSSFSYGHLSCDHASPVTRFGLLACVS
jgi:hypothetical protein